MALTAGIDVGSAAVKLMALADGTPVHWVAEPTRPDIPAQCEDLLGRLAGDSGGAPDALVSTGYGRRLVPGPVTRISEIVANAVGAGWVHQHWASLGRIFGSDPVPASVDGPFRTVIDVGGQDSKIITLEPDGLIRDFAMNDRCAAGTGRFLEVMARVLEVDLATLNAMALRADEPAAISSACTVFAESEVISLISEGTPLERIAAGVFLSVADQVASLAAGCRWEPPVLFDGGPAGSRALVEAVGRRLSVSPAVPPCAQLTTALGAAVLASEMAQTGTGGR